MNHDQARELIGSYVDGELDAANAQFVEQHLRGCPECAGARERLLELREILTSSAPAFRASNQLKRNVRSAIRQEARSMEQTSPGWFRLMFPTTAFALLFIGFVLWQGSRGNENDLADEVIANHVRSLLATHLVDVPSSDQHTVKPWFNGKIDFAPEVRDLSAEGYPLVGGRLDYLDKKTVVALVYRRNQHPINLLIAPAPGKSDVSPSTLSRRGYHLVHWTRNEMSYWAVSDVNVDELRQFASYLAK